MDVEKPENAAVSPEFVLYEVVQDNPEIIRGILEHLEKSDVDARSVFVELKSIVSVVLVETHELLQGITLDYVIDYVIIILISNRDKSKKSSRSNDKSGKFGKNSRRTV